MKIKTEPQTIARILEEFSLINSNELKIPTSADLDKNGKKRFTNPKDSRY